MPLTNNHTNKPNIFPTTSPTYCCKLDFCKFPVLLEKNEGVTVFQFLRWEPPPKRSN